MNGEYQQTNNCAATIPPGRVCSATISFSPTGTGARSAQLIVTAAGNLSASVNLTGIGIGSCGSLSACGSAAILRRLSEPKGAFYIFKDSDSGLNHGFASGVFSNDTDTQYRVIIDPGCIDSQGSSIGCSMDPSSLDVSRGTVMRISFPPMTPQHFAGINFRGALEVRST